MKLNRRQLAVLAVAPVVDAVLAQTPPQATDLAKAAHENNRQISDALAKFEIPIATEPAFQFKA